MVLVFCLLSLRGSGISLSFTYGSDRPFGSIGTRFLPSLTGGREREEKKQESKGEGGDKKREGESDREEK